MRFDGYMRGINFGGWFSQCDNTEKRYEYFIRKDDFRRVARWGLDHIRIPVDYNLFLSPDGSFLDSGFRRLENCVLWCGENGLNLILDLHKTPGFSFDSGEGESGLFEDGTCQEQFFRIWEEFAKRFGKTPYVAFELLNEVTSKQYKDSWNTIAEKAVSRIRKHAPETKILFGGYYNNSVEAVKDLASPFDRNIVYNFHCYSPLIFTHQGAYWIEKMPLDFRMPFESTCREYREYTGTNIGKEYLDSFGDDSDHITSRFFIDMFSEAAAVAERKHVPLYCGEYGVIDRADPQDTVLWFRCIHDAFEHFGIGRAVWSYKEMDFGLVDAHYDDIRSSIIDLL